MCEFHVIDTCMQVASLAFNECQSMIILTFYSFSHYRGNHLAIFKEAGLDVRRYRYYNPKTNGLDYDGMLEDLEDAPDGSIILLHACAHNPTGCDPTLDQWKAISKKIGNKSHHVFFDSAYQGFASGAAAGHSEP